MIKRILKSKILWILVVAIFISSPISYFFGRQSVIHNKDAVISALKNNIAKQVELNKTKINTPIKVTFPQTITKTTKAIDSSVKTITPPTLQTTLINQGQFMISGQVVSTTQNSLVFKTPGENILTILSDNTTNIIGLKKPSKNLTSIPTNAYATITIRINGKGQFIASYIRVL